MPRPLHQVVAVSMSPSVTDLHPGLPARIPDTYPRFPPSSLQLWVQLIPQTLKLSQRTRVCGPGTPRHTPHSGSRGAGRVGNADISTSIYGDPVVLIN